MNKPTGLVTFLFTDIEGSTKLAQEYPEALHAALDKHNSILQDAIESNNGFVFEIVGDAFCSAFQNAQDAVKAAIEIQLKLAYEKWEDAVIKIRVGIHSGNAEWSEERYMGYITLARTARVMSSAYGGQVILTENTHELLRDIHYSESSRNISFRDLGERRLKDVIQPIRLFQIFSPGLQEDFPPLKTLDSRPNNLPVQLTSFIGKEKEMKHIKEILGKTHLLTLTGSGGAGKSRLALQVGADIIDDFNNGVWFVELAAISESELLPQTVMKVLNLKEEPQKNQENILCDYLKDKELVIILDNCEHMIESCALLTEKILTRCTKIKIIATSREALRCEGELTHRIQSLNIPDPKSNLSPEKLSHYESVRLFIERALAVNKNFRVNNDNAPALAQICFQLDGIPLAIELAAARTNILTLEKIYERLNDRFKFLTGGKRTALPRQQTLRAMIDWSYDLLSDNEKNLWKKISVFSGGFNLEAAEKICTDEKIPEYYVLDLLSMLAEKSIIIFDDINERYLILETIKQYGEEKLTESGVSKKVFSDHLECFMQLSEKVEPDLNGNEVQIWLEILEAENSNFQSAIEWSIKDGYLERGARLAGALGNFWFIRGHYSQGRRLLENIIERKQELDKSVLGKILNWAGILAKFQGDYEKARSYYEEYLEINRESGNKTGIASALSNLGNLGLLQGDFENAKKILNESLTLSREINDKPGIASSLSNLGSIAFFQGDYDKAQEYMNESLPLSREIGNKRDITNTLITLGNLAYYKENHDRAQNYYTESLALNREIGNKRGIVASLTNLGNTYFFKSDYLKSQMCLEESLPICREIGDVAAIVNTLLNLGNIAFFQGDYYNGKKFYEESLELSRGVGNKREISNSLQNLGVLSLDLREDKTALKFFEESLALRIETGDKLGMADTLSNLGIVIYYLGDIEKSQNCFDESLALFLKIDNKIGYAYTLTALGNLKFSCGKIDEAKNILDESLNLNRELGSKRELAHSLDGLGVVAAEIGNNEQAEKYFEESLILRRELGDKKGIASSLYNFGKLRLAKNNYEDSLKFFTQGLELNREMNYQFGIAESLIGIAWIKSYQNQAPDAVLLLGKICSILNSLGAKPDRDEQILMEKITAELKDKMNNEDYSKYFEEGKELSIEQVTEKALFNVKS